MYEISCSNTGNNLPEQRPKDIPQTLLEPE